MLNRPNRIGPIGAVARPRSVWTKLRGSGWKQGSFFMNTHPDFEELFRLLEEHGVEYMIVGGYAVAYHGHPRFTKDIDVFFQMREKGIEV